jgi:hypothetical protein
VKFICFFLLILSSAHCLALETDNYLSWKKELRDSSAHIDRFFEEGINEGLRKIPSHESKACSEMTVELAKDFASFLVHDNPVENWLFKVLNAEEMFPGDLFYVEESIYREPYLFYIPWFGLAPTIQVNGHYFGTDKLSHFASTGMIYYKIYVRELQKGRSHEEALRSAIDWGVKDEMTVHGYWASGVFSYADLESNYQGLLFYLNFCQGDHPYLQLDKSGEWKLAIHPEIKNFVSGLWDESFELSYRLPENWNKVQNVLKEEYCALAETPHVRARMSHYLKMSNQSFSKSYLEELKRIGLAPDPAKEQSFSALCSLGL